jgi:hypothetical protein
MKIMANVSAVGGTTQISVSCKEMLSTFRTTVSMICFTETQRICYKITLKLKKPKLNSVAFSPQANYTDRATAACWRS